MNYIVYNESFIAFIPVPGSLNTDTVTYNIYNGSDGSVFQSGSMIFVANEIWKVTFTPNVLNETYILKVNDTTISSQREDFYKAVGAIFASPEIDSGDNLTTLANFKINFNIPSTMTNHDTLLSNLILQKSKEIKKRCGRTFILTTYDNQASDNDILYDVNQDQMILLRNYPIQSVASINIDWNREWGSQTLLDPTNYVVYPDIGKIAFKYPFTYWYEQFFRYSPQAKVIQVLYTAGYDTIPADLTYACECLVMADYLEHLAAVNVAASNDVIYRPDKLRKSASAVIDNYKAWFSGE